MPSQGKPAGRHLLLAHHAAENARPQATCQLHQSLGANARMLKGFSTTTPEDYHRTPTLHQASHHSMHQNLHLHKKRAGTLAENPQVPNPLGGLFVGIRRAEVQHQSISSADRSHHVLLQLRHHLVHCLTMRKSRSVHPRKITSICHD